MPHNEIANSPSQPMLIPSGPFAGQMWVADVTYGGIQRAFLEKVEGEYQGAYFRMTQGLESGITHMLLEDDGSIIVGGLGAGGNWGQDGKLQFGLQKLVPNGTETFDIQKMELADGGFKLTYTKPLSDATLTDLAEKYQARQWTLRADLELRRPEDRARRRWTSPSATVSADRKVVTLKLDGLKPNRVVYVRSPRPFDAQDGTKLLSTEAWYTLNKLPGYVAPVGDGLYELEDGILTGGAKFDTEHAGYSGTGFVSGYGTVGASTKIEVNAPKAGDYRMALRYANGPNPFHGPKKITLDRQRHEPADHAAVDRVVADLPALPRHRGAQRRREHDRAQVRDRRRRQRQPRLPAARAGGHERYEAEAATLAGGANAQTEHAGYSGLGYVGGYQNLGASTTFKVTAFADGETDVTLGYVERPEPVPGHQAGEPVRQRQLREEARAAGHGRVDQLPDVQPTSSSCAPGATTSRSATTRATTATSTSTTSTSSRTSRSSARPSRPNDPFDGTSLNRCRWTTILNEDPAGYSVADGKLQIKAQGGDITGGTVSAKNVVLQPAPTDGSWSATTKVSIDGTDDYIQAGLVAHVSASAWAKVVVMRRPNGEWTTELGRQNGYQNGPALPANAQKAITLQMYARDGQMRGRYSLDDGADLDRDRRRLPARRARERRHRRRRLQRHRHARSARSRPSPSASRRTCRPRRRARRRTRPRRATRCCSTAPTRRSTNWKYAGGGRFVRDGCTIKSVGDVRPAVHRSRTTRRRTRSSSNG